MPVIIETSLNSLLQIENLPNDEEDILVLQKLMSTEGHALYLKFSRAVRILELVIVMGVFPGSPVPYPHKPVPANEGTGFHG